jgi:molybdopterin/thiamine biosynthesis adenylyltransferase/rhodanese-related sulfurtransferase
MNVRDLISATKASITEIEGKDVHHDDVVFIDVREPAEIEGGIIPGALTIARGVLETNIENRVPDRSTPLVIYCASGIRSAFATKTLNDLGYENVKSLIGGFNKWKDDGRDIEIPRTISPDHYERYQRHILLPEVGEEGQQKLFDAKVLLLGAGGLGSPAALYLAASGIGSIGVIDMDVVDKSNLQRQVMHSMASVGMPKTESAKSRILSLNPDCHVTTFNERLSPENVIDIISQFDLVVDGTDNFPTRYMLNDASVITSVPVVHGSIFRFEGQVTVLDPAHGPCYRCMLPEPPPPELAPSCAEAGVLGVLPGIVGSLQALEAIKFILGIGDSLVGKLLAFDSLEQSFRTFDVKKDPGCRTCGDGAHPVIKEYDQTCKV